MTPYIIFITIILFAYFLNSHRTMFVAMLIFAAIRYDVGWDYAAYFEMCLDEIQLEIAKERYSYLWYLLFNFAYIIKAPEVAIITPAILTQACIYTAINIFFKNDQQRICNALLFYICWPFLYLQSFSIIRQALAISVVFLSMAYAYRHKLMHCFFFIGLGVYLHPSAVISIPAILILMKRQRLNAISIVGGILVAVLFLSNEELLFRFAGTLSEAYGSYLGESDDFGSLLLYLLSAVVVLLCISLYKTKDQKSLKSKVITIALIGLILEICIYVTGISSVLTRSLLYYTTTLSLIFFDCVSDIYNNKAIRYIAGIALISLFLFYLIFTYAPLSDNSASNYIPYTTIFSK